MDTGDAANFDLEEEFERLMLKKNKSRKRRDNLIFHRVHKDVPFPKPKTGTKEYIAKRSHYDPMHKEKRSGRREILSFSDPSSNPP